MMVFTAEEKKKLLAAYITECFDDEQESLFEISSNSSTGECKHQTLNVWKRLDASNLKVTVNKPWLTILFFYCNQLVMWSETSLSLSWGSDMQLLFYTNNVYMLR